MNYLLRTMLGVVTAFALVAGCSAEPQTKVNPKDGATMVWIPEGEILMGSDKAKDKDASENEQPQRKVYLDGYWIYATEVTVAQYKAYCAATGEEMPKDVPTWSKDDHPMVMVNWLQARAYCRWAGGRLPSEAQWEKAAGGTDGRKFPWGNTWDPDRCNNGETGPDKTMPVGSFPEGASPYGCLDMAGNVWEWCEDWYSSKYYQETPARNPTGPTEGDVMDFENIDTGKKWSEQTRVLRGGSWSNTYSYNFRCANRFYDSPDYRTYYLGFRCVQGP